MNFGDTAGRPLHRTATQRGRALAAATVDRDCDPMWSLEMMQILGLSLALLLFGSGIWANVGDGGPLSQNKGAWVSNAIR
jgi:hypothetical protein